MEEESTMIDGQGECKKYTEATKTLEDVKDEFNKTARAEERIGWLF